MAHTATEAAVTGIVTVSIAGVNVALSHADILNWGNSIMSLAPLLLILFLTWRMYKMDQQHKACQDSYSVLQASHDDMQKKLLFAYMSIHKTNNTACSLPTVEKFAASEFDLPG